MRPHFYTIGKYELTLYTFRYYWVESIDCYFAEKILPFFDQICMRKDLGSIQTVALSIICNFVAVAWPAAAQERHPAAAREGPQADSRNPGRIRGRKSSSTSTLSRLQLNYIGIFLIRTQKLFHHFFRVPRGETRWGDGVHSRPWRPP
jgi:hypothetical protein